MMRYAVFTHEFGEERIKGKLCISKDLACKEAFRLNCGRQIIDVATGSESIIMDKGFMIREAIEGADYDKFIEE